MFPTYYNKHLEELRRMGNVNGGERVVIEGGDVPVGRGEDEREGGERDGGEGGEVLVGRGVDGGDFAEVEGGDGVVEGGQGEEDIVSKEGGRVWARGENLRNVRGRSKKRVRW